MYDIVLKNGKIIDGKGNPWFYGDIGIKDGFISKIGRIDESLTKKKIDVKQKIICPGFIDAHSHSDYVYFIDSTAESKVRQGITTEITGNCGFSAAPNIKSAKDLNSSFFHNKISTANWNNYKQYIDELDKLKKIINIAPLIGHGTIRAAVVGFKKRKVKNSELEYMKKILENSIKAGAFGLSFGLYFSPGSYADKIELINLARVLNNYNRVLSCHIRDEGSKNIGFINSIKEVIKIAEETSVSLNISHIKAFGSDTWGLSNKALEIIENARSKGIDITCDLYPYTFTGGLIASDTLPLDFCENKDSEKIISELKKREVQIKIRDQISINIKKRGGAKNQIIASYPNNPEMEGKTLKQICNNYNTDPAGAVIKMLIEGETKGNWISKALDENDVINFIKYHSAMIGSDGKSLSLKGPLSAGVPHPRNFGAFPAAIEFYVNNKKIITLHEMIRKMTSLPAQKFSIYKRGCLEEGYWADLVVFDSENIKSATLENPKQYPKGISHVIINGKLVIENMRFNNYLSGKICSIR